MHALIVDARDEAQIFIVNLNTAESNIWRNLRRNATEGKRTYENVGVDSTDGLLTEEEEEDDTAIGDVLDWITDMCTENNVWNPAADGRLRLNNVVKIILRAE